MAAIAKASVNYNEAFAARVRARLRDKGKSAKDVKVVVGISEKDQTTAKTDYLQRAGRASLIDVALANEFGTDVLPERSWFRSWFDLNANRIKLQMTSARRADYRGDTGAIRRLAVALAIDLRAWITEGRAGLTPLDRETQRARVNAGLRADPPLFATGQLVNAIGAFVDGEDVGP